MQVVDAEYKFIAINIACVEGYPMVESFQLQGYRNFWNPSSALSFLRIP
jgi:hypothetical protein